MRILIGSWILALAVSGAADAACLTKAERDARIARHLQTQLMVGALQCRGGKDQGQRAHYNRFIQDHQAELAAHGEALITSFRKSDGAAHQKALDSYVTRLANEISLQSQLNPRYCDQVAALGVLMTSSAPDKWRRAQKTAPVSVETGGQMCTAGSQ